MDEFYTPLPGIAGWLDKYLRKAEQLERGLCALESMQIQRLSSLGGASKRQDTCLALVKTGETCQWGTRKRAAHGLYRPTHERPAADSPSAEPTERWCSDSGKERANVTGKSARSVGLHPSRALGLHRTEAGMQMERATSPVTLPIPCQNANDSRRNAA